MISHLTSDFIKRFRKLPDRIKRTARKNYKIWKQDISHPGSDFKQVHPIKPIYSVRIGSGWRALGIKEDNTMIWFWIGSHNDYEKLIRRL